MTSGAGRRLELDVRGVGERVAADFGLEVVDVRLARAGNRWRVRIDIDRAGPSGVGLEDCQQVSRRLGEILDESDLIPDSYVLEISSPGVDRPIRSADDVRRNTGRRIVVQLHEPLDDGRNSFHGVLAGADGDSMRLRADDGSELSLPLAGIALARQETGL